MSGAGIDKRLGYALNPGTWLLRKNDTAQGILDPLLGLFTGNEWSAKHKKEIGAAAALAAIIFSAGAATPAVAGAAGAAEAGAAGAGAGAALGGAAEGFSMLGTGAMGAGALGGSVAPNAIAGGMGLAGSGAGYGLLGTAPNTLAFPAAASSSSSLFGNALDYAKYANQLQGLMSPEQQQQMPAPMAQRPQMVAQGGGMGGLLPYGDPAEEEKWRRMQQSGRFYG